MERVRGKCNTNVYSERQEHRKIKSIKNALERELKIGKTLQKSSKEWSYIINDINSGLGMDTPLELEWETRYHNQRSYNQMLRQQVKATAAELLILKRDQDRLTTDTTTQDNEMSRLERQKHIRNLEREIYNLKSTEKMYERQLDDCAREYHNMKDDVDTIVKDVWFAQGNRISVQEEKDRKALNRARAFNSSRCKTLELPPIKSSRDESKNAESYLNLYAKKVKEGKVSKCAPEKMDFKENTSKKVLPDINTRRLPVNISRDSVTVADRRTTRRNLHEIQYDNKIYSNHGHIIDNMKGKYEKSLDNATSGDVGGNVVNKAVFDKLASIEKQFNSLCEQSTSRSSPRRQDNLAFIEKQFNSLCEQTRSRSSTRQHDFGTPSSMQKDGRARPVNLSSIDKTLGLLRKQKIEHNFPTITSEQHSRKDISKPRKKSRSKSRIPVLNIQHFSSADLTVDKDFVTSKEDDVSQENSEEDADSDKSKLNNSQVLKSCMGSDQEVNNGNRIKKKVTINDVADVFI